MLGLCMAARMTETTTVPGTSSFVIFARTEIEEILDRRLHAEPSPCHGRSQAEVILSNMAADNHIRSHRNHSTVVRCFLASERMCRLQTVTAGRPRCCFSSHQQKVPSIADRVTFLSIHRNHERKRSGDLQLSFSITALPTRTTFHFVVRLARFTAFGAATVAPFSLALGVDHTCIASDSHHTFQGASSFRIAWESPFDATRTPMIPILRARK